MDTSTKNQAPVYTITVNEGNAREYEEVVRPLCEDNGKTMVAYIRGAQINTKWVSTDRIKLREDNVG